MLGKLPNSASMFSPTDLSERPQALFLGEMENLLRCEDEKQTNILTKEIKIFDTQKRHGQKVAKKMRDGISTRFFSSPSILNLYIMKLTLTEQ